MYPLRFEPLFRRYIWGGRRLATVLNKPTGDQKRVAKELDVRLHDRSSADEVVSRSCDADILVINKIRMTEEVFSQLSKLRLVAVTATG